MEIDRNSSEPPLTRLLAEASGGDTAARERLAEAVYAELHRLASRRMRGFAPGQTLQTTALIHEAYIKMLGAEVDFKDRVHFLAVAARAMRMILIDAVRAAGREKRGGGRRQVTLDEGMALSAPGGLLLDLHEALERLERQDQRKAALVELHYFGGLSYAEIAAAAGSSEATVHRELRRAKAWLRQALEE